MERDITLQSDECLPVENLLGESGICCVVFGRDVGEPRVFTLV